jgi:hypothetical protein
MVSECDREEEDKGEVCCDESDWNKLYKLRQIVIG